MGLKIRTEPFSYISAALILLLVPAKIWMAALLAASVHELLHLVTLWILGGQVMGLVIGIGGAKIEIRPMSRGKEALCALSGPFGSFSLLALAKHYPLAAFFGFIQGTYNLLPIYPLDGGRIMRSVFSHSLCAGVEGFTMVILWGLGIYLANRFHLGLFPLFPAFSVTVLAITRKSPCKEGKFAVQ